MKFRNSHWRCSVKKDNPKTFVNFTGKHLWWSLILIKFQAFSSATLHHKELMDLILKKGPCRSEQTSEAKSFEKVKLPLSSSLLIIFARKWNWTKYLWQLNMKDTLRKIKTKQEIGDDLSTCVLNILPKVSSLPSLLAINRMKVENRFFKQSCDLVLVTWSKGPVWEH